MARPTPNTRSAYPVFRELQTRWHDNDLYGHMNNTVHYQLFDTVVNGWLVEQGLLNTTNSPWVFLVVETGCKYFAELKFPQTVHAGMRITNLGGSSLRYEIGLFTDESDVAAAEGHFVHVQVGREDRRPTPIDEKSRAILAQLQM